MKVLAAVDRNPETSLGLRHSSLLLENREVRVDAVHAKIPHHAQQPMLIAQQFRERRLALGVYRSSLVEDGAIEFVAHLLKGKNAEIDLLAPRTGERAGGERRIRADISPEGGADPVDL
jgi:hypothetical protein